MKLPIQRRFLVDGEYWDLERPILDAQHIGDRIIVVFDYMSFPRYKQARTGCETVRARQVVNAYSTK